MLDNAARGALCAERQGPASFWHGIRRFGFRSFSRVRAAHGWASKFPTLVVVPMRATGVVVRLGCSARAIRYNARVVLGVQGCAGSLLRAATTYLSRLLSYGPSAAKPWP